MTSKRVIRVGDPTDHGGHVLTGYAPYLVYGKPVARIGDICSCPRDGHDHCTIVEGDSSQDHVHLMGAKGRELIQQLPDQRAVMGNGNEQDDVRLHLVQFQGASQPLEVLGQGCFQRGLRVPTVQVLQPAAQLDKQQVWTVRRFRGQSLDTQALEHLRLRDTPGVHDVPVPP
jgi:hypothetical protein